MNAAVAGLADKAKTASPVAIRLVFRLIRDSMGISVSHFFTTRKGEGVLYCTGFLPVSTAKAGRSR
jgi:hypothetical protein